jgi:homoserine dehydrogenase
MTSVVEFVRTNALPPRERSTVRVALAGCGAVGSALLRELAARRESLEARRGARVELLRVLVRDVARSRDADFDRALLTSSVEEFLESEADVVIEAIGGIEPARRIAEWALRGGRELVTANKELLAAHGTELSALARRHGGTLRYDAAVGGGVPVLRLLDDALGAGTPTLVRGILNGTTNYVLTRLERGAALDDALAEARRAGFAEEDASRDLDGRDAAAKLALVTWAAFGVAPESLVVRRRSLLPDPVRYVQLAARCGRVVRQVAECALLDGAVIATVEPVLVPRAGTLGRVRDEQNHVEVHSGWSAPLCASGPGAGGVPTATALLSDFLCTARTPHRREVSADWSEDGQDAALPDAIDRRRSDWVLEVAGAPVLLHRGVPNCGLVHTDASAARARTLVTDVLPSEIDSIIATLRARGADPIAVRLDPALGDTNIELLGEARDDVRHASPAGSELPS